MNQRLCFLTYLARSGSTLLASELDQYESIGVTLEENLPDGIKKGKPVKIKDSKALEDYLEEIYRDKKFQAWDIDKSRLKEAILGSYPFPLRYKDILNVIHYLYFAGNMPEMVIHKQGNYCLLIEKVRKEFPDAMILFIDRDPRAIHNSQKKSINSISEKFMNAGIVRFALTYKRMQEIIRRKGNDAFFYTINYEDLIKYPDQELKKILDFFQIRSAGKNTSKSYFSRIPGRQKHLHQNVPENYNSFGITRWKEELEDHRIAFLQTVLRRELLNKELEFFSMDRLPMKHKRIVFYWLLKYHFLYILLRMSNWNYFSLKRGAFRKFGYG